jgi:hypothetical protein
MLTVLRWRRGEKPVPRETAALALASRLPHSHLELYTKYSYGNASA